MLDFLSSKTPKILIIGDLMIDNYIYCDCNRASPEAPVLVMNSKKQEQRLGGAANVYANLKALGANVSALSVVGDDENGKFLKKELNGKILLEKGRISSLKTRILSQAQQILRLDNETVKDTKLENELLDEFYNLVKDSEAIILSDYGKGVLTDKVCKNVIKKANELKIPVLVDPKGKDYSKYKGASLLTPNKKEALEALKFSDLNGENLEKALIKLKKDFSLKYSMITLSEDGIAFLDDKVHIIPTKAREVFDVTGAGDSVISILAFCMALNLPMIKACELANKAAAVVVSKLGSATVSFEEIRKFERANFEDKIKNKEELASILKNRKNIVFTNGCFDILHFGHIQYLEKARTLGDLLVVGLNSDKSVKKLKGDKRPINSQFHRACLLASLYFVDFVVIFDEDTPYELIKALKPDILVKGADYTGKEVVGSDLVKKVELIKFEDGFSTTSLINKIINNDKNS
ncbi:D-glycero-beta-D-manno-heptose-7-phosphate kinase [uncultured Campylobacter sp.]|uniref:D-glycero-beta-D-manno-heptose-7-phosphate kinase n=1 Tax=uncultured Campylobacter sp. TaxID=218934 RepID=UPI002628563C|nr:D-glycero-beta-D-manno-heptose-7-phosphate kinase [uncultured Campylobacter sp.]